MEAYTTQNLPLLEGNENEYSTLNHLLSFVERHMVAGLVRMLLLLEGIEPNPGPRTWRCSVCSQIITKNTTSVKCNGCGNWCHQKRCSNMESHLDWTPTYKAPCCGVATDAFPSERFNSSDNDNTEFDACKKEYKLKIAQVILHRIDSNPHSIKSSTNSPGSIPFTEVCKEEFIDKEEIPMGDPAEYSALPVVSNIAGKFTRDTDTDTKALKEEFVSDKEIASGVPADDDVACGVSPYGEIFSLDSLTAEPLDMNDEKYIVHPKTESRDTNDREEFVLGGCKSEPPEIHNEDSIEILTGLKYEAPFSQTYPKDGAFMVNGPELYGYNHDSMQESQVEEYDTPGPSNDMSTARCDNHQVMPVPMKRGKPVSRKEKLNICHICKKRYKRRGTLMRHLFIHTGEQPCQCDICMKSFKTKGHVEGHKNMVHSDGNSHVCMNCGKQFKCELYLRRHEKRPCGAAKTHQKRPREKKLNVQLSSCTYCGKSFKCMAKVRRHIMSMHSDKKLYECDQCGKKFKSKDTLIQHMVVHSNVLLYECGQCDQRFKRKSALKNHMSSHSKGFISCSQCKKQFMSESSACEHIESHFESNIFECDTCGKKFSGKGRVRNHIMLTHLDVWKFVCKVCNKRFQSKSRSDDHFLTHSTKRPFPCHICDKSYKSRDALNSHVKLHFNTEPFVCSACGKTFNRKFYLKLHMRCHSVRPHTCTQCRKSFETVSELRLHTAAHLNPKNFSCEQCEKTFQAKVGIRDHVKTHFYVKLFKCIQCGKKFKRNSNMKRHMTTHPIHVNDRERSK